MEPITTDQIDQDIASFIQQVGKYEELMHQAMGALKYAQAIKARLEPPQKSTIKKARSK